MSFEIHYLCPLTGRRSNTRTNFMSFKHSGQFIKVKLVIVRNQFCKSSALIRCITSKFYSFHSLITKIHFAKNIRQIEILQLMTIFLNRTMLQLQGVSGLMSERAVTFKGQLPFPLFHFFLFLFLFDVTKNKTDIFSFSFRPLSSQIFLFCKFCLKETQSHHFVILSCNLDHKPCRNRLYLLDVKLCTIVLRLN